MGQHLFLYVFFGFYQELDCQHPTNYGEASRKPTAQQLQISQKVGATKSETILGSWTYPQFVRPQGLKIRWFKA
jgi:hypothetical protein